MTTSTTSPALPTCSMLREYRVDFLARAVVCMQPCWKAEQFSALRSQQHDLRVSYTTPGLMRKKLAHDDAEQVYACKCRCSSICTYPYKYPYSYAHRTQSAIVYIYIYMYLAMYMCMCKLISMRVHKYTCTCRGNCCTVLHVTKVWLFVNVQTGESPVF